jgi:hypothetical protein
MAQHHTTHPPGEDSSSTPLVISRFKLLQLLLIHPKQPPPLAILRHQFWRATPSRKLRHSTSRKRISARHRIHAFLVPTSVRAKISIIFTKLDCSMRLLQHCYDCPWTCCGGVSNPVARAQNFLRLCGHRQPSSVHHCLIREYSADTHMWHISPERTKGPDTECICARAPKCPV